GFDVAINIQGDEPFIDPQQIDLLVSCFENPHTNIATLVRKVQSLEELTDPNKPKVVLDKHGQALYFSRQAVPYLRDEALENWLDKDPFIAISEYTVTVSIPCANCRHCRYPTWRSWKPWSNCAGWTMAIKSRRPSPTTAMMPSTHLRTWSGS